jgi:hypothetical protein
MGISNGWGSLECTEKYPLGKLRRKWQDNIKIELREIHQGFAIAATGFKVTEQCNVLFCNCLDICKLVSQDTQSVK